MIDTDNRYMRHALAIGARGLGQVWPSPAVGCVLVKDDHIVGRGWTQPGGIPHAETVALSRAGPNAKGCTAYVTLEPCAHHGRTPPCAAALIAAGVARVVIATNDPNPKVDGQGAAMLRNAGIVVTSGILEDVARAQHVGFMSRISTGRPMVTLKLAASFDGRIAMASSESQWITGPIARRLVHAQRACHDAVMVGGGTARSDDPTLIVRDLGVRHQPVRVIWSRQLDLPLQGRLAQTAKDVPLWILHTSDADSHLTDAWSGLGAQLITVPTGTDRRLDPAKALTALGDAGLTRIYCEGGSSLAASLLVADLVDDVISFNAGIGIGGEGLPMVGEMGLLKLAAAKKFDLLAVQKAGNDTMSHWRAAR